MTLDVGTKTIGEIYYGDDAISEVWKGDDLVWSGYAPDVDFIFRDIDENGNLTLATGNLESGNELTKIGPYGMYYAFYSNKNLTGKVDLSKVKSIGDYGLYQAFYADLYITELDLSGLKSLSATRALENICYGCKGLVTVNLSNLVELGKDAGYNGFQGCTSLVNIYLNNLTKIAIGNSAYYMFQGCTALESVNLSNLVEASLYGTFQFCSALTSINLNSLEIIGTFAYAFRNATSLTNLSFPSLKSIRNNSSFSNMLLNVNGCTVHFPSNLQSVIGSWSNVTNGFGGTNTTVLFDLPATE